MGTGLDITGIRMWTSLEGETFFCLTNLAYINIKDYKKHHKVS